VAPVHVAVGRRAGLGLPLRREARHELQPSAMFPSTAILAGTLAFALRDRVEPQSCFIASRYSATQRVFRLPQLSHGPLLGCGHRTRHVV
jgi:hypothetical protein